MSSSDFGKLESNVEIKASAAKFHDFLTQRPHHLSNISSEKIQGIDLHEGEWGTAGAVVSLSYIHEGKPQVEKHFIEAVDGEKNLIKYKVIEGEILEHFKSFVVTLQVTPKLKADGKEEEEEGSIVHYTFEYEKHHDEIVDPHTLLQFALEISKDIDAHLNAQP